MRKLCLKAGFFLITCKLFNVIVKTVKKNKLFSLKEKLISVFCDEVPMSPSLFLIEQDPSVDLWGRRGRQSLRAIIMSTGFWDRRWINKRKTRKFITQTRSSQGGCYPLKAYKPSYKSGLAKNNRFLRSSRTKERVGDCRRVSLAARVTDGGSSFPTHLGGHQ